MTCLVMAVVLTGCGEKTAEKKAEKAIEESTGGQVDVDIGDNTVKVNTNAGSFAAGDSVNLPSGFPSDVHVVSGTITAATTITEIDGYNVSIQTTKTVNAVKEEYETQLAVDGWTITLTLAIQDGATIGAEKDNRTVTVSISQDDDGKALVMMGTSTNQE